MIKEIIIVRTYEKTNLGEDLTVYDIRDQDGEYLYDYNNLDDAIEGAMDLADCHEIEFVKIQVKTESE